MKKRLLLIAVAGAIVVGCADEMLDTSYESVLKEAQLKGDHPLVFNAYVGNGMANTRATVENDDDFITDASQMTGGSTNSHVYALSNAAGVFAYYTGNTITDPNSGIFNNSTSGYSSDGYTGNSTYYNNTKFLDNAQIKMGSSGLETCLFDGGSYTPKTVYWPTPKTDGSGDYVSFFAYYPHVNTLYSDYANSNLKLNDGGIGNFPTLDYQVATPGDNFPSIDLMAAQPVLNKDLDDSSTFASSVDLKFKHLLAAVSVHINWANTSTESPEFFFTKAEIQGCNNSREITDVTMFRKRGIFDLYSGMWMFNKSFEPLNLLGSTWLTQQTAFQTIENSGNYPLMVSSKPSKRDFDTSNLNHEDEYMLIIPNGEQEGLAVNLSYMMKNGSYVENVDLTRYIDGLKIEPGKYYQILLTINKNELTFNVTIDGNNWDVPSTQPSPVGI